MVVFFPIGGQKAVDRGIVLPRPWGISFIGVSNVQEQLLNNGDVAISRDFAPPKGTPPTPIPFVAFDNVISDTTSKQLKVDVRILPFLNLYGVLGKVTGEVNLDVNVGRVGVFPVCRPNPIPTRPFAPPRPPICIGENLPDTLPTLNFDADVDATTATLGLVGVYGWGNYWISAAGSLTDSIGKRSETRIRSQTASARFSRRWAIGRGNVFSPYIGVSYFNIDQRTVGTTPLLQAVRKEFLGMYFPFFY